MHCSDIRESLSAFIDGELPYDRSRSIEQHLEGCETCRAAAEELRALRAELAPLISPPPVSEREWDELMLAAVARHSERIGWVFLLPGLAALVVGAFVALFTDPEVPLWLRLALGAATAGVTFLTVSATAERWRARRSERYEGIER